MVAFETTLQIRVCVILCFIFCICAVCVFVTEKRQHLRPVAAFVS